MKYILLFILLPILGKAQKIETDKIDDFTKERLIQTSAESICNNTCKAVGYVSINKNKQTGIFDTSRVITIFMYTESVASTDMGSKFYLKLEDGNVIELHNENSFKIWSSELSYVTATLTQEQIEKLRSNNVLKIRVDFKDSFVEREVDKRKQDRIKNIARLISDYKL